MKIGVICAMEREIEVIREGWTGAKEYYFGSVRVTEVEIFSHTVYLAISGIGKVCAAMATEALIAHFSPDAIINTGLAGGSDPRVMTGDAVLAEKVVYHDLVTGHLDIDFKDGFYTDARLRAVAAQSFRLLNLNYIEGTVATGDVFVEDSTVKQGIVDRTGCSCVDMEAAAVAHVARANGVPLVIIKIISDNADEDATEDFAFSLENYAHVCASLVYEIAKRV